jgi:hypothetical protein
VNDLYERISVIQRQLAEGALTPDMARESLVRLTSLLGNVHDLQRRADHDYKLVLLGCMKGQKAASRARIEAETTPQFDEAEKARNLSTLVIEMIRSLKETMRSQNEEMRFTPRQG